MSLPKKCFLSCNNQQCKFGCGFYLPVGVPDAEYIGGPDIPAKSTYFSVKCKICGCVGGQHLHDMTVPSAPNNDPPHPANPSVPRPFPRSHASGATEDTLFGSRSTPRTSNASTPNSSVPPQRPGRAPSVGVSESRPPSDAPPQPTVNNSTQHGHGPFRAHGMRREERMTDLGEDSSGRADHGSTGRRGTFNPADKAYSASAQFDKDDRGKRKRRQSPTTSRKKAQTSKTDSKTQASDIKSQTKKAAKTKRQTVNIQFVLLPQTSAVYDEKYKRPNLAEIVRLHDQGFVSKKVSLSTDASNEDVRDAVSSLQSGCFQDPTVASFLSTYGWQTLQAFPPPMKPGKKTTQGETYYVKTMRNGRDKDVDVQTLKQATAFTGLRGGPRAGYDNLVLIALPQYSPEIPFKACNSTFNSGSEGEDDHAGTDSDGGECDEGMDEGENPDDGLSDNGPSNAAPPPRSEQSFNDSSAAGSASPKRPSTPAPDEADDRFQAPQDDAFEPEPEQYFETYTANEDYVNSTSGADARGHPSDNTRASHVSDAHVTLRKLLLNMHAPEIGSRGAKVSDWWAGNEHPVKSLREFLNERPWVENLLDKVLGNSKNVSPSHVHLPILLFEIDNGVIEPLTFLLSLAEELLASHDTPPDSLDSFADTFREQFAVGPGGLHAVCSTMTRIYSLLDLEPCERFGSAERKILFEKLHARSQAALALLSHLRRLVPLSHWVPKPHFREFLQAYNSVKNELTHASSVEWEASRLSEVDIMAISVTDFQRKLSSAFGHPSNHLAMNNYAMKAGEFGLERFIHHFIIPILDDPPLSEDERYDLVLDTLQTFLGALTRKLRNFAKTRGKSSKSAKGKEADRGTEKPKSTRNTRSSSKKDSGLGDTSYTFPDDDDPIFVHGSDSELSSVDERASDTKRESTNKGDEPRPPPFEFPPKSPSTDGGKGSWRDLGEDRFKPGAKEREDAKSGKTKPPHPDPPPAKSPPKPRPKVKTPTTPLETLQRLEERCSVLTWSGLVNEVLKNFPHPSRPIPTHTFNHRASLKVQYGLLTLRYHPDKNDSGIFTQEWHTIASRICTLLNTKRDSVLGVDSEPWVSEL